MTADIGVKRLRGDGDGDSGIVPCGPGRSPGNGRPSGNGRPLSSAGPEAAPERLSAAKADVLSAMLGPFQDEGDEDECPGIAVHCQPARPGAQTLTWINVSPGESRRVLDHTCVFHTLSYELLSLGGRYIVRRSRSIFDNRLQHTVTVIDYSAHPWRRGEADRWWILLIAGAAR